MVCNQALSSHVDGACQPLYQLLLLLGRTPLLEEFNQLNTIDLAMTNDRMWAHVCTSLGWKFLPTV